MSKTTVRPIGHQVHSFQSYPTNAVSRSKFDRSNTLITTMDSGYIVPIWYDEAVPGDTLLLRISSLSRLATQIVPFMDHMYMDIHVWCVPNRLIWSHWVNFMGEQPNKFDPAHPLAGTDYLTPQLNTSTGVDVGSIYDYFGIPTGVANLDFNAFNFRAYNLVYDEWYRDENIIDPVSVPTGDNGADSLAYYSLQKRGKRKDYFTSCLPFPQKGPAVDLPLGLIAPVYGDIKPGKISENGYTPTFWKTGDSSSVGYPLLGEPETTGPEGFTDYMNVHGGDSVDNKAFINWREPGLRIANAYADLSDANGATINSFRQALAVQKCFEKDARGGSRYTEMMLSHFGIKSPDDRLQRPEFLGGGTFDLSQQIVPQTSGTTTTSPQGNLSAYGVVNGTTKQIVHSFTEHCIVFAVASIRADLTYQQGLDRMYSRRNRFDYYLPTLANLGEQAVLNKEIFAQGKSVTDSDDNIIDDKVFGYQERWSEMRYKPSRITGLTRSDAAGSLDVWHLAQDFANLPTLNKTFIEENVPVDRVIAVSGENTHQFICNFYFDEQWVRPLPVYSIPSMSSHF